MLSVLGAVLTLDDDIGGCQGGLDIAALNVSTGQDVAVIMHERRARQQRSSGIENARQLLVLDLDELGGVVGDLLGFGSDEGDRFTGIAHAIASEDGHGDQQLTDASR